MIGRMILTKHRGVNPSTAPGLKNQHIYEFGELSIGDKKTSIALHTLENSAIEALQRHHMLSLRPRRTETEQNDFYWEAQPRNF